MAVKESMIKYLINYLISWLTFWHFLACYFCKEIAMNLLPCRNHSVQLPVKVSVAEPIFRLPVLNEKFRIISLFLLRFNYKWWMVQVFTTADQQWCIQLSLKKKKKNLIALLIRGSLQLLNSLSVYQKELQIGMNIKICLMNKNI